MIKLLVSTFYVNNSQLFGAWNSARNGAEEGAPERAFHSDIPLQAEWQWAYISDAVALMAFRIHSFSAVQAELEAHDFGGGLRVVVLSDDYRWCPLSRGHYLTDADARCQCGSAGHE
jgi:hypothetical protein